MEEGRENEGMGRGREEKGERRGRGEKNEVRKRASSKGLEEEVKEVRKESEEKRIIHVLCIETEKRGQKTDRGEIGMIAYDLFTMCSRDTNTRGRE